MTKSVTLNVSDNFAVEVSIWYATENKRFEGRARLIDTTGFEELYGAHSPLSVELRSTMNKAKFLEKIISGSDLVHDMAVASQAISHCADRDTDFRSYLNFSTWEALADVAFDCAILEDMHRRDVVEGNYGR